jgi:hypothetical protein
MLFSIVHYSETLFIGSKSTYMGDQLLLDRGRYGIRHHSCHVFDLFIDFQFGNVFYCSAFIMVQGEFLGVLEALAYDDMISQLDRGKIL